MPLAGQTGGEELGKDGTRRMTIAYPSGMIYNNSNLGIATDVARASEFEAKE